MMFPALTEDKVKELKAKFAAALLRNPEQAFMAGQEVFGADTGKALYVAQNWINDDDVLAAKTLLLKSHGARAFLPTKEEYAREVWKTATDPKTPSDDKKYLLSLYGDIMGYKQMAEKPGVNVNVMQQSVMVVKDHGSDDDWERAAQAQQAALTRGKTTAADVDSRPVH